MLLLWRHGQAASRTLARHQTGHHCGAMVRPRGCDPSPLHGLRHGRHGSVSRSGAADRENGARMRRSSAIPCDPPRRGECRQAPIMPRLPSTLSARAPPAIRVPGLHRFGLVARWRRDVPGVRNRPSLDRTHASHDPLNAAGNLHATFSAISDTTFPCFDFMCRATLENVRVQCGQTPAAKRFSRRLRVFSNLSAILRSAAFSCSCRASCCFSRLISRCSFSAVVSRNTRQCPFGQ